MDAREIESLIMISRGFTELKEANPALSYNIILDILSGINEYVFSSRMGCRRILNTSTRNPTVRQHVQTSRGLFPHKRVIRKSEMTAKGLVVTEVQEDISGLPIDSSTSSSSHSLKADSSGSPVRKSPIAELLYMRWLEGLRIKWPSILS
jgi:serine/threonine-protein kinase 24/25/MST4